MVHGALFLFNENHREKLVFAAKIAPGDVYFDKKSSIYKNRWGKK